jgi:hypothetical protein
MENKWIEVIAESQLSMILRIDKTFYEYSVSEPYITKFKRLLRYNQGRALAYLRKKAFAYWKKDDRDYFQFYSYFLQIK